ncbi:MAG: lipid-A-disaccharide synthase [Bryobacteraceae bacterium]|nr:lipid-A-disaccharide synthase [Bryobacteraceae bacterium]
MPKTVLISAGEPSGDRYAARLTRQLRLVWPGAVFFGSAGAEMRAAGVEAVVRSESLSVVGLAEVVTHLPRIHREYRRLVAAAAHRKPDFAVLADSPGFHLHIAKQLKKLQIPVFYLIAPQAWAWRSWRAKTLAATVRQLHCIFPFEEAWYRERGVDARYIGHPLAGEARPLFSRQEFMEKNRVPAGRPVVTLAPGSREGEIARHLPVLAETVKRLAESLAPAVLCAAPQGASRSLYQPLEATGHVRLIFGETRDALAHADVVLGASGTVTTEAALLQTPVVAFYRVSPLTYAIGKPLVRIPFFTMVNLIAGRAVIEEYIQDRMTPENLAAAVRALLCDPEKRARMKAELGEIKAILAAGHDPFEESARLICASIQEDRS